MRDIKKRFQTIIALAALCFTLAGCGGVASLAEHIKDFKTPENGSAIDPLTQDDESTTGENDTDDILVIDLAPEALKAPDQETEISEIEENRVPLTSSNIGSEGVRNTTALPVSYDSRSVGRAAPVRDQANLGTCWAFASLSALESRLLPEESWDFSEDHMSHDPYFLLGQTGGGEYTMAMAYLLSWRGPVREEDDPYGDQVSPSGLPSVKHVQEILLLPDNDREAVKRAVMEWGSVETSVYMDMVYINDRSDYYNPDTAAYCCTLPIVPNHDITIIGWDDDFPKEAFTQPVSQNGAFLCENNWGTEFGRDGFFYVSYEDRTIGSDNVVYTGVEPVNNYSEIFQCDECGWIGQMGYGEESAWAANVYRADREMSLAAAGFYAIDQNTEYEVYVVSDVPEDPQDADFAVREKVAGGKLSYAGYYTIDFDRTISVPAGRRFAVIIHLTTPGAIHPIAIEYDSGDGKCVVRLDGESYASYNGRYWENTQESQECDVCLKVYAK